MFLNRTGQQPGNSSTKAKVLAVWMTDNSPNRGWRRENVRGSRRAQRRALGWNGEAALPRSRVTAPVSPRVSLLRVLEPPDAERDDDVPDAVDQGECRDPGDQQNGAPTVVAGCPEAEDDQDDPGDQLQPPRTLVLV